MKRYAKRAVIDSIGWLFVLLGVVGIFLPFLQGVLFILVGIYILSLHSTWAHKLLVRLKMRYPRVGGKIDAADHRIRKFLGLSETT